MIALELQVGSCNDELSILKDVATVLDGLRAMELFCAGEEGKEEAGRLAGK